MNRVEYLLSKLAEECNEAAQRCMKAQQFGPNQVQIGQNMTNVERVTYELNDVYAMVDMLRAELGQVNRDFGARSAKLIDEKREKVSQYMELSRKFGALEDE